MTLGFQTRWPAHMGEMAGQPNYFVDKIFGSLLYQFDFQKKYKYEELYLQRFGKYWDKEFVIQPKLHSIRLDTHDRWKPGMKIHPVVHNRTKNRFQFAPVLECVSIQHIDIIYCEEKYLTHGLGFNFQDKCVKVKIDGVIQECEEITRLSLNDGFPSIEAFFQYFNKDFTGKIIHWTGLGY